MRGGIRSHRRTRAIERTPAIGRSVFEAIRSHRLRAQATGEKESQKRDRAGNKTDLLPEGTWSVVNSRIKHNIAFLQNVNEYCSAAPIAPRLY
jgi:hypothetical protein